MSEKVGIEDLKEAVVAAAALAVKLVKLSKDGIDLSDLAALLSDGDLRNLVERAVAGSSKLPEEVKDLDVGEAIELAGAVVPVILEGLK